MSHVVIVGAGPAGASLALLLARNAIRVTLIERRRDFAREFRGEVLMPSGVSALQQMGLGEQLHAVPSHTQQTGEFFLNQRPLFSFEFDSDPSSELQFMAVSQVGLLEMLVEEAGRYESFTLIRGAALRELRRSDQGSINGVCIRAGDDEQDITADLVVGADGRNSAVRRLGGFVSRELSPPMDIVWCRLPCPEGWLGVRGYVGRGHILVVYHTWGDALQLGWVILKGTFGELRERGIENWVEEMAEHVTPDLAAHLRANLDSVQKPFLLDAASDCVERWHQPGALLIGDAAHTMSPVGAQGINIALRDAIVAANHLVPVLSKNSVDTNGLDAATAAIEAERMPEVSLIQDLQAQPPKLILSRAWWGEPVRGLAGHLLRSPHVRQRAAGRIEPFLYGDTDVRLEV